MVVTCARKVSASYPGGHPLPIEPQEVHPPVANPSPAPAPPTAATQAEQLAVLTQQVQNLTAMIHGLREQQSVATQHQSAPPVPPPAMASQQSARGQSPRREAGHRRASPKGHRREEPLKRSRSPDRDSDGSPQGPRHEEGLKRRHFQPPSSPSSSSSSRPSRKAPAVSRRAEERLDEYHRRLEELTRMVNNQPIEEYDTRPPYTRRVLKELVPFRFHLPQLDPYDGTTDPLDYLESYKALMQVQGATDALLCKAFSATLRTAAHA